MKKCFLLSGSLIFLISIALLNGCSVTGQPRTRLASYATATVGTAFLDTNGLGNHNYGNFMGEGNGVVYTCKAGHIDIAHLRIASDYVNYLYKKVRRNLINEKKSFTFKLNVESSIYHVKVDYPANWDNMDKLQRQKITDELALELSEYFTYTMTTWHEILTWYGFKCIGLWPEDASAFSWEDIYSNLLGVKVGSQAIAMPDISYDKAATIVLKRELEKLGIQPASVSQHASEKMKGQWYGGTVFVEITKRNIDIGLDDGMVTPTLVPGICSGVKPYPLEVPTLDKVTKNGFKIDLQIEPHEFEKDKILRLIYPDGKGRRIIPEKHFPIIMQDIKKTGSQKGYDL